MDIIHAYVIGSTYAPRWDEPAHPEHQTRIHALRDEARRARRQRVWRLLRPRSRPTGVASPDTGHATRPVPAHA